MDKKQQVMLPPGAYELLVAQIEALPYALAKPLLQLLRSNARTVEVTAGPTDNQNDKA
ncbi:hypothetical protein [Millionella massiliensis]|uniref:hypothetical protein n=1 Tax=Millionella massiliensis TaxID=1871023 RepID=UPI001356528A|nr:hypothetical protein [Millionella massiliensis]